MKQRLANAAGLSLGFAGAEVDATEPPDASASANSSSATDALWISSSNSSTSSERSYCGTSPSAQGAARAGVVSSQQKEKEREPSGSGEEQVSSSEPRRGPDGAQACHRAHCWRSCRRKLRPSLRAG